MEDNNLIVINATDAERAEFYRKTYGHVAAALLAFIGLETLLVKFVPFEIIAGFFGMEKIGLLLFIGLVWLGSILASRLSVAASREMQYVGLSLYVIVEAIIFLPLIYIAVANTGLETISQAATITLLMFSGLTAVVFTTNKDFSFLRAGLIIAGFIAVGIVLAGILFGFTLGLWFSVAMVVLASAAILYQTSQIKDHYTTDMYVGAALQLFSSVMLLFFYILRILNRK